MCAISSSVQPRIRHITSAQNSSVKRLRALLDTADKSDEEFAFEGDNLLAEAIRSGLQLKTIFISEDRANTWPLPSSYDSSGNVEIISLPNALFRGVVATDAPQGIAAIAKRPVFHLNQVLAAPNPLVLITASIQDPGNLGTLIRSAEAFGAAGVLALPGTVSAWNQKALRASAGSTFRVPVIPVNPEDLSALRQRNIRIYAAVASGTGRAHQSLPQVPCAIMIGNEGSGLSPDLIGLADALLTIPCSGPVDSLNAAIAGSILLYEASQARAAAAR